MIVALLALILLAILFPRFLKFTLTLAFFAVLFFVAAVLGHASP